MSQITGTHAHNGQLKQITRPDYMGEFVQGV